MCYFDAKFHTKLAFIIASLTFQANQGFIVPNGVLENKLNCFNVNSNDSRLKRRRFKPCFSSAASTATDNDVYDDAIDADTLGIYSEEDYNCLNHNEYDLTKGHPNDLDPALEYITENEVDEEGVEVGWDPMFGSSNTFDTRTIITESESYMTAEDTKDDRIAPPPFFEPDDPESALNDEVKQIRKDMKIIDTYRDEYLDTDVPRNVATWYGDVEGDTDKPFEPKDFENNRFTKPEDKTDFYSFTPTRARKTAIEVARSKNNEWLPPGVSEAYNNKQVRNFVKYDLLAGSIKKGECNPVLVEKIQPAMNVLGSTIELLSIQEEDEATVYRFRFWGPIKHKRGMQAWMETLLRDCDVPVTGVVFEAGDRKRDKYD